MRPRLVTALSLPPALILILFVPAAPARAAVATVFTPPDPVLVGQFMPADGPSFGPDGTARIDLVPRRITALPPVRQYGVDRVYDLAAGQSQVVAAVR